MTLKEKVIQDLDELDADGLVALSEQIRLLKRARRPRVQARSLDEVLRLTASSKSTWAEDIARDRAERG